MATISEALAIAVQHHQAGRLQAAEQIYRQILAVEPNQPDAWHLLGVIAYQVGKHEIAADYIGRAIRFNGTNAAFHSNLGNAFKDQGKLDDAAACYRRALELEPHNADAYYNLGNVLREQGKPDEAIACCRRAVQLRPNYVEAHNNLGNLLREQGHPGEAIASLRRTLELNPNFAEAHGNLGIAFKDLGKLDEAVACCRRALELKPDYAEAHYNLGVAFNDQGKLDEAVASYRRAVEVKPDYADAHLNLGLALLLAGDWQRGWPEYQWRWQTKNLAPRGFAQPLWNGESLAGKTILLHAEQGLGDTIQFVRFAPIVKQHGGTVILECQQPLVRLLEGCAGVDQLVGQGDAIPTFDVHAPLMSVPGVLRTSLESIPAKIPYLHPAPALLEQWRETLTGVGGFKIGIAWQGNPALRGDSFRSIPLGCFAPLTRIPGVRLISLQKGAGSEQLAQVRDLFAVMELGSRLHDFVDTAAVMKNLDLVITADMGPAHLAGALGVPVWVALRSVPDWRWLLDRADSPWYPTMRLFRQKEQGNWEAVFQEIASALCQRLPTSRSQGTG